MGCTAAKARLTVARVCSWTAGTTRLLAVSTQRATNASRLPKLVICTVVGRDRACCKKQLESAQEAAGVSMQPQVVVVPCVYRKCVIAADGIIHLRNCALPCAGQLQVVAKQQFQEIRLPRHLRYGIICAALEETATWKIVQHMK